MLLVPFGYNEGFATPEQIFSLHDKTHRVVRERGVSVPPDNPQGMRGDLVAAEMGPAKTVTLSSDRLRGIVPEAVDDLELVGGLGLLAVERYYHTVLDTERPITTHYDISHRPSAHCMETTFILLGDSPEHIQDGVTRSERRPKTVPSALHFMNDLKTTSQLGYDRMGVTHHRALSAIVDAYVQYPDVAV